MQTLKSNSDRGYPQMTESIPTSPKSLARSQSLVSHMTSLSLVGISAPNRTKEITITANLGSKRITPS